MTRDSNIPLFLWIATAVLGHLMWGGGVNKMSRLIEETLDIKRFAFEVRERVRGSTNVEVALLEEEEDKTKPDEKKDDDVEKDEEDPVDEEEESKKDEDSKKKEADTKKEDEKQPPEKAPDPAKKEPQKLEIKVEEKKKEEEALKEIPKPDAKKRIAVVQNVEDKNQKDNPNADLIADEANTVKEQTQARITSTDQNDPKPTPGGAHAGPTKNPGDSDESRVAQSEDKPGVPDNAPTAEEASPKKPQKTASVTPPPPPPSPGKTEQKTPGVEAGSAASKSTSKDPAQKGQKAQAAREEVEASPETLDSSKGSWSVGEAQAAQKAQKARKARKKRLPPMKGTGGANDLLGLGAAGMTANGINLNLTPKQALAAVGRDRLVKERKQDAERRKSAHRGSWQSLGIERWRSAIENYVPSVKPGNQTALNTARVPFASYLNTVHNRLHPIFADSFLASLDSLPGSHPMNKPEIKTDLEIVLTKDDGRVVRMGVTHTSGVTAFDIAALESVMRAQPFGPPPNEIVSPDGNVYFHWEFYRNPYYACSTYFAHPFILKAAPKSAPPSVDPPPWRPLDPKEGPPPGGGAGQRHGFSPSPGVLLEQHAALR